MIRLLLGSALVGSSLPIAVTLRLVGASLQTIELVGAITVATGVFVLALEAKSAMGPAGPRRG